MSETPAATPATNAGTTRPAGEGVDDAELSEQVADSTDSNLEAEGAFERESDGAATDTEIAKADADELQ
jgi:hypothetical protein